MKDLSNVASILAAGTKPTRTIMLYALTGVTQKWIADDDYLLIGFIISGSGNSWFLGVDSTNPATIGTSSNYLDTKIAGGPTVTNTTPAISGIAFPIPHLATIYLVNGTAGSMAATVYLQRT